MRGAQTSTVITAGPALRRVCFARVAYAAAQTMYRIILWIRDRENRLWVRPAVGGLLAVLIALLAAVGNRNVPPDLLPDIGPDTVEGLLRVIASSMLAVTTFSLSIMVAAFATAAGTASPRATELVASDEDTHTAIAAFISAFIYSIVALTALGVGLYGPSGRFILFVATILVLVYLIVTLVRWVKTLSKLGRMNNTLAKIEYASARAMASYRHSPTMGARAAPEHCEGMRALMAPEVAYVRHIDMKALQEQARAAGVRLHVRQRPGTFVHPDTALLYVDGDASPDMDKLLAAFVLGAQRSYDQDPRFGLVVLSEVAQRALSPAVNDPGTAIQVMNTIVRVLVDAAADPDAGTRDEHDALTLVALDEDDFIEQGFDPIARDGAGCIEVQLRMQKLLAAVADNGVLAVAARRQAARSLQRAEEGLVLADDLQRLRELFDRLHSGARAAAT